MKLQSLQIHGFKSFADRTTLDFREGVTAIIGSNGCGKSNIADAIRWVLGEQRASAMRGAKMEEVIFQGTTRRRPLNFAEVSLHFENDRGRVAIPQTEIAVTRKVFREGGSEYALNRNSCRLRDIHNLLRDTGLGSNAYAVIEAGMIETLLSDRAEERRMLFEEAAGIGRYKDSRQAATRRLESAEADLARLGDLIAEVESKVRSLSRQRRRAERHAELRAMRLNLEVWLAESELSELGRTIETSEGRCAELEREERTAAAQRSVAELGAETRRADLVTLGQRRITTAGRLDQVRRELETREREMLIAQERGSHADMRIAQLVRERTEVEERRRHLAADIDRLRGEVRRHGLLLEELRGQLEVRGEENRVVRAALAQERAESEAASARARAVAREIATAEGERSVAERRRQEVETRTAELVSRERDLQGELERLAEQTELWEGQVDHIRARISAAVETAETAREEIRVFRAQEQSARDALRAADDRLSRLASQVDAREAVERSYEGFAPAVAALMAARERVGAVHGPLADFVTDRPEHSEVIERFLGPLLQAVVVADLGAVRSIRAWFREEWHGGGSLWLLPLDALTSPGPAPSGSLWAETLLRDLVVLDGDPLVEHLPGVARVGREGEIIDGRGVVRLADRGAGQGILARREELVRLREERDEAVRVRDEAAVEREARRLAVEQAEERALEAEEIRRVAEAERRRVEADAAAHQHHHGRLEQDRRQLVQTLVSLRDAAAGAAERIVELQARLDSLSAALREASVVEARARGRLDELENQWECARDEEAEIRVAVARAEGEAREAERRLGAAEHGVGAASSRLEAIEREAAELRATLDGLSGVRERAGGEIEELFRRRDQESAELAALDARIGELDAELASLDERARAMRRRESECSQERHQLELRLAETRSRAERVVERLEVEWARPWEILRSSVEAPDSGTPEEWQAALRDAAAQLESLGPVNMLAMEEHAEEEQRLNFLMEQRADLTKARDDLVAAIRQINRTAREMFSTTFETVRGHFHRVFQSLFQGGECDIWLADPDDPLESLVEIQASPKGKRTQRIHLLSGGERTLTALALLFALYLVKPSPFCVLDEIDAPLDEANVGRFIQLLHDFKSDTQFVVITHNPRTMEAADWVYGVTMEEPGVSTIVGVELLGAWQLEDRVA